MALDPELLEILACPRCKGTILMDEVNNSLVCRNCRLVFEIRDIPNLLTDEAKPLDE